MIAKEVIVRTAPRLVFWMVLLSLLSSCVTADSAVPTVPPWRSFPWDISKKDSLIEKEFIVTEHRSYDFDIEFHHNGLPDDWNKFIGDGGVIFFNKDPLHPTRVRDEDVGGNQRIWELYHKGELVLKHANPGVIVPVHIRVEKIDEETGYRTLLLDKTVDTEAMYRGGNGVIARSMSGAVLKPGRYKVSAATLIDVPLPRAPNHETYTALGIVYYAKVDPIGESSLLHRLIMIIQ